MKEDLFIILESYKFNITKDSHVADNPCTAMQSLIASYCKFIPNPPLIVWGSVSGFLYLETILIPTHHINMSWLLVSTPHCHVS